MSPSKVFLGVHGDVVALDRTTGQELWHAQLPGSDFLNLLVDQDPMIATTRFARYLAGVELAALPRRTAMALSRSTSGGTTTPTQAKIISSQL